jgi:hypothetical protein
VPALRERTGDISMLVGYLVDRYAQKTGKHIRSIAVKCGLADSDSDFDGYAVRSSALRTGGSSSAVASGDALSPCGCDGRLG